MDRPGVRLKKNKVETNALRLRNFPGFSKRDLRDLERYYASQLVLHDSPEKRVGWKSAKGQRVRFENLVKIGPLHRTRILDVGCGLGAFLHFLREEGIRADYRGVDLFPGVIREARRLNPGASFEARVLTAKPFPRGAFDYSFLSGVFNVKVKDNWKYMRALLKSVLRQTKRGVAFNALNAESGLREKDRFTVEPRALVRFGRQLGVKRVHLLDGYHHLDLTLFLYK